MRQRTREPLRLLRAIAALGDTRKLKAELDAGNPYALRWIERRGCSYENGSIVSRRDR